MLSLRYALVAYVKSPVGEFVENLRRELHPELPHLAAHLTLLPPRLLKGTEGEALQSLAKICGQAEPFEVTLGDMQTFVPTTPTVYIRVAYGAARLQELHDLPNKPCAPDANAGANIREAAASRSTSSPLSAKTRPTAG